MTVFGAALEDGDNELEQDKLAESYQLGTGDKNCPYRVKLDTGWGGTFHARQAQFNKGRSTYREQCSTYSRQMREKN